MNPRRVPRSKALLALLALHLGAPCASALAAQDQAEEQYRFLAGLAEKGLHELAIQEAQTFLREHEEHAKAPLARYRLAGALWELDRRDEAAREYEALARIEAFEYRAESCFRAGEAAHARGDVSRARAAFESVLRAGQDYLLPPALFALAEIDFAGKRFEQAEPRYIELLRTSPECEQAPLARRALVWCAWEKGDAAQAAERARAFLGAERVPAHQDELRVLLGEALLALEQPAQALEAFRAIRTREQADARARGEGFALAAAGDHAAAARAFEGLLANAPGSPHAAEARLQAGIERLRAGDASGARERLREAASGGDPEALYWLAQAEKGAGDPRAALASLERALRAKPRDELAGRIRVLQGDCLSAQGNHEQALRAYEQSGSERALQTAAVTALNQGDAEEAVRLAERLVRAGPGDGATRLVLGEAYFAARRTGEAERVFAEVLADAQDGDEAARARSRLAWCRYLAGDLPGAATRFGEVVERHPGSPQAEEALSMRVRIALERQDPAGARAAGRVYLERHRNGRSLDQVLLALARSEPGEGGRGRYEELLERCPESPLRSTALLELAESESAAGAHESAARRYAELLQSAPGSAESARAVYGLAWCQWERGEHEACSRSLAPLVQDGSTPVELREAALELLISAQVRQEDLAGGLQSWHRLASLDGDQERRLDGARSLVAALRAAGRGEEGRELLEACRKSLTDPGLVTAAWIESAYLALEGGDLERAERALAGAAKQTPQDPRLGEAAFHLGEARLASGDEERALELFARASATENPRAADALYQRGFVSLRRGDLEATEQVLDELLAGDPQGELAGEARFLLGEALYRGGSFERAAEHFARARTGAREELLEKILFRLGLTLGELERWEECEAALGELAKNFPRFPNLAEAELWRGRALSARNKGRAARAAFERVLGLDQGDLAAAARLGLGQLFEAEGRPDEALSEYLKVALLYAHEDSVAEALFRSGRILEAVGDGAKASERYRELIEQHPRSSLVETARERLRALEPQR